jgi:UDP:flavonoid glycosyltransferase YjiC (YdhE family)
MLVIPHIIDQFIWGNKVVQLGVGPQPISRSKLKVDNLTAALRQMQSPEMRLKAADLGAAIRAEPDGVKEAVRLIEGAARAR